VFGAIKGCIEAPSAPSGTNLRGADASGTRTPVTGGVGQLDDEAGGPRSSGGPCRAETLDRSDDNGQTPSLAATPASIALRISATRVS
jgi:hypothetical protein